MVKYYNFAARPARPARPAEMSGIIPEFGTIDQSKIVRWVIIPGATVVGMVMLSSIFKRGRRK